MYIIPVSNNYLEAQYLIGVDYLQGNGLEQDYAKALEWFYKSASEDYALAQDVIGCIYSYGFGVEQDYEKAFEWCLKAANQGYSKAQNNIAYLYKEGFGVPQDDVKAFEWYKKAAEQGDDEAQYHLANIYRKGIGVTRSFMEAIKWLEKASAQNYADAQYELATYYEEGIGVNVDANKAYYWFNKAAELGHTEAILRLQKLVEKDLDVINDITLTNIENNDEDVEKSDISQKFPVSFKEFFDSYFRDESKKMPLSTGGGVWFFESMSLDEIHKLSDKAFNIKQNTDYKADILNADFIIDTTITKNYGAGLFLHLYENSYTIHLKSSAKDWKIITEVSKARYHQADKILSINGYEIILVNDNARFYAERLAECINAYLQQNDILETDHEVISNSGLVTNALDNIDDRLSEIDQRLNDLREESAA